METSNNTYDIQYILNYFTYRILNPTPSLIIYTRVQLPDFITLPPGLNNLGHCRVRRCRLLWTPIAKSFQCRYSYVNFKNQYNQLKLKTFLRNTLIIYNIGEIIANIFFERLYRIFPCGV